MRDLDDNYVMRLMQRSAPRANRPRLSPEVEDMFRQSDADRAMCYARTEHMVEQLSEIEAALDSDSDENEPGVVVGINEGDSLVHHIDEAVASLGSR